MKTTVKIQELSDGRFRNTVTGKIGDSVSAVVKVEDAPNPNLVFNSIISSFQQLQKKVDKKDSFVSDKTRNLLRQFYQSLDKDFSKVK